MTNGKVCFRVITEELIMHAYAFEIFKRYPEVEVAIGVLYRNVFLNDSQPKKINPMSNYLLNDI